MVLEFYQSLIHKRQIGADDPFDRIKHMIGVFEGQLRRVNLDGTVDDYEAHPELMSVAFSLSMFVNRFHCPGPIGNELNRLTYQLVVEKPLDLTNNRTFLGKYQLL